MCSAVFAEALMRTLFTLIVLVAFALPALAGDCGSCSDGSCCGIPCPSKCPIAQQANGCRALGEEADCTSSALCQDSGDAVEENLGKI